MQINWKAKATEVGDLLSEVWPKIAWLDKTTDSISGVLAEIPFPLTTDPVELLTSLASVAVDLALDAVTAVPVAGWIIGIVVGIGKMLAPLFEGLLKGDPVPSERRAILPWRKYNEKVDEAFVRTFLNVDNRLSDWNALFSPPTKTSSWSLADGVDEDGNSIGQVLAPFSGKGVAWMDAYGCLPGTFRVAGILQYRGRPQPAHAALRFYNDGTLIHLYGDFTQTGDFFPSLQQLAGTVWQQIAAGGPDAYKVDCVMLETLWRDWFSELYTSVFDQGHGDWLLPFLAREVGGEWRLGTNAGGFIRAEATDGTTVPLVTKETFTKGTLATPRSWTTCLYTDIQAGKASEQSGDYPRKFSRDPKTGVYTAPPPTRYAGARGHTCIPWPPGELLLAQYRRADEAIVIPALRAVAELQRRRLSRSLDCAYVRPEAVGDKPIYAAFRNTALQTHCMEMRKRLLTHPSRFLVDYETAREIDRDYAAALKEAGVPTTQAQRAAVSRQLAGKAQPPLDGNESGARLPPPLRPQGGLPFDVVEATLHTKSNKWGAVLGGAAVLSSLAAVIGVARHRRKSSRDPRREGSYE
ncbi:hypothetical protein [Nannocystis bainbridge]|uniref:Uncharacterized protein n=1 Tax=Nannocystis bainbridge TaxID=2995303 RepID=A0ABT5DT04_9BACT|nr:hypothetical protein [Nannocystis bainbridge]MDC0716199.1 hypothetical protein [Nannocystis bainbridge]